MGRKRAIETVTRLEERKMVMMILKLVMMIKNDHDVEDGVDDDDDDDYDDDGCMFCSNLHKRPGGGTGVLRISSDGDDRMGTKIKTQQNP